MSRIFVPSTGPNVWRWLLADPSRHWVPTKSAFECAVSWESARRSHRGLPESIANALDSHTSTANAELVLAIPELHTYLEADDIRAALAYAARRTEQVEPPLP